MPKVSATRWSMEAHWVDWNATILAREGGNSCRPFGASEEIMQALVPKSVLIVRIPFCSPFHRVSALHSTPITLAKWNSKWDSKVGLLCSILVWCIVCVNFLFVLLSFCVRWSRFFWWKVTVPSFWGGADVVNNSGWHLCDKIGVYAECIWERSTWKMQWFRWYYWQMMEKEWV